MRKLSSILLGVALVASMAALVPAPAKADFPWCAICEGSWDCYACCRCEGLGSLQCGIECGGAALACADDSLAIEEAVSADETAATADNEAPGPEELTAVAADEALVPEEPRPVATQ